MSLLWSAIALIASLPSLQVDEAGDVPAWVVARWSEDSPRLTSHLQTMIPVEPPDAVHVHAKFQTGDLQVRRLAAFTEGDHITIELIGKGWQTPTSAARKEVQQNFAHELVHVHQLKVYDHPYEPRWLHEGFAEAISLELLVRAQMWTDREAGSFREGLDADCAEVLERGPLAHSFLRGERQASYACGFVLIEAMAAASDLTVSEFFAIYASAQRDDLSAIYRIRDLLPPAYLGGVRRFLYNDHREMPGDRIVAAMRGGRL